MLIPSDDVALLLRWRRIDKGRRDGTTREETMESALFLSSPFYQPREHTVHPHAWLFGKSADVGLFFGSLFRLVHLSPFFLSLSTFYPFLHFPSSSYLSNTSSISPDAILGLVNSGSTQISVRGLFTRRLIISDKSEHSQIFAFLVIYQPLSLFLFFIEA